MFDNVPNGSPHASANLYRYGHKCSMVISFNPVQQTTTQQAAQKLINKGYSAYTASVKGYHASVRVQGSEVEMKALAAAIAVEFESDLFLAVYKGDDFLKDYFFELSELQGDRTIDDLIDDRMSEADKALARAFMTVPDDFKPTYDNVNGPLDRFFRWCRR